VGYTDDANNLAKIVNNIHDAVIADANPPEILVSAQLFATVGSLIGRQAFNFRRYRPMMLSLKRSNSFRVDGLISSVYLATQTPALDQVSFDSFKGNAFLLASLF
jgi:hypothetical protein